MSQCVFISFKFTSILGNKNYRGEKLPDFRRSDYLQILSPSSAWVYPKECNLCLKFRVQRKSERYKSYITTTYTDENTIKAAAKGKNETFYTEIKDLDLIAKKFKFHKHCYQQYTNVYAYGSRSSKAKADKNIAKKKDK